MGWSFVRIAVEEFRGGVSWRMEDGRDVDVMRCYLVRRFPEARFAWCRAPLAKLVLQASELVFWTRRCRIRHCLVVETAAFS